MLRGFQTRSIDLRGKSYTKYGVWQFDLRIALFVVEAAQLIDKPHQNFFGRLRMPGSTCSRRVIRSATSGTTCDSPLSDKKQ
jgi:hypothetical protein